MAVGFLYNQNMLQHGDQITAIDYDEELSVVIVRTALKPIMKPSCRENQNIRLYAGHRVWGYYGQVR